ncbi:hypothetical protein F66182_7025 [Fusarium sp. NRRL 66182]|nr:hypothetical protein F66182_7025 [Fusarium sp. NRRL 66182]
MSSSTQRGPLTHLQLIPADNITAVYDGESGQLLLRAAGKHADFTRDISFHRLPFTGGLLFQLQGWVGPIIRGESPYQVTDGFNIQLPTRALPSNTVIVNTENKKGWVVQIQYHGKNQSQPSSNGSAPSAIPEFKTAPGEHTIVAPLQKPITIAQTDTFTGEGGSVNITFDRNYLAMTDAGITNDKIEWTFDSLQTGTTEVVVFVGQSNPPFFYRVPYQVNIESPKQSVTPKAAASLSVNLSVDANGSKSNGASTAAKNGANGSGIGLPLSWDGFVNIGYNLILKQFPTARLYEIDATPLTRETVDNQWGLVSNKVVAGLDDNKTAVIQSTGWGEFGQVQVIDSPWLGDVAISWPVSLEIGDAFSILRKGGYTQGVGAVTLRQPLYPGDDQPFYIFNVDNQFIAVGVNDNKIYNFGVDEHKAQSSQVCQL